MFKWTLALLHVSFNWDTTSNTTQNVNIKQQGTLHEMHWLTELSKVKRSLCHRNNSIRTLIDWFIYVLRPTWHKIGHVGDVLPSQSLGLVLKKLNLTQQKQTISKQNGKNTKSKPESKENLNLNKPTVNFKNCSYMREHITVHNCHTQHSTEQFW